MRYFAERRRREAEEFEIRASLQLNCSEQVRQEVAQTMLVQAQHHTQDVDCFASGRCVLQEPEVIGCEEESQRRRRHARAIADDVTVKLAVRHDVEQGECLWQPHRAPVAEVYVRDVTLADDNDTSVRDQLESSFESWMTSRESLVLDDETEVALREVTAEHRIQCPVGSVPGLDDVTYCGEWWHLH